MSIKIYDTLKAMTGFQFGDFVADSEDQNTIGMVKGLGLICGSNNDFSIVIEVDFDGETEAEYVEPSQITKIHPDKYFEIQNKNRGSK